MLTPQEAAAVACVTALTGTTEGNATALLVESNWSVDAAVNAFFDAQAAQEVAEELDPDSLDTPIVLSEFDQSVDTFCSLTGASKKTASAMLEQNRQSIHHALHAFYEIDSHDTQGDEEDEFEGTEFEFMSVASSETDLSMPARAISARMRSSPLIPPTSNKEDLLVANDMPSISAPLPDKGNTLRSRIRDLHNTNSSSVLSSGPRMRQVGHHPSIQPLHRISTASFRGQTYPYHQLASRSIIVSSVYPPELHDAIEVHISTTDGEEFDISAMRDLSIIGGPARIQYKTLQTSLMHQNFNGTFAGIQFNLKSFITILERKFIAKMPQVAPITQPYCAGPLLLALIGEISPTQLSELKNSEWLKDLPTLCIALDSHTSILQAHLSEILGSLQKRASTSRHIAQIADFIAASNTCSPKLLENVPRDRQARDLFNFIADSLWGRASRKSAGFFSEMDAEQVSKECPHQTARNLKLVTKFPWQYNVETEVYHPFNCDVLIDSITVESLFKSKTRPALVTLSYKGEAISPSIILKRGDDIRRDAVALSLFSLMNSIWDSEKLRYNTFPVLAPTFRCMAMDDEFGCYEYMNHSSTLRTVDFEALIGNKPHRRSRVIATAAGSYFAAYVLGVRDRHNENILVTSDGLVFHIDFGYILGNSIRLDTGPFAITPNLKRAMGKQWEDFVTTMLKALAVLQKHFHEIEQTALLLTHGLFPPEVVSTHLKQTLFMDEGMDMAKAHAALKRLLQNAPTNLRTRAKNTIHTLAQSVKK